MDTHKTHLNGWTKEIREITMRPGVSSAGPRQLGIVRKEMEPDAKPFAELTIGKKYAKWGKNNRYPQEVVDVNIQDTTSAACLNFKVKAHYGQGLYIYRKVFSNGKEYKEPLELSKYPEIEDFFFRSDIENYIQGIATDFEWWNWAVTEMIATGDRKKVYMLDWKKAVNCRMEIMDERGKINNVFYSPKFGGHLLDPVDVKSIPIFNKMGFFDPRNKNRVLPPKSAYIHKQNSVDRSYYPFPMWQSNNKYLNLSLEISDWILSNINNSMNIKYHIEYPLEYFELLCPMGDYGTEQERQEAIQREKQALFGEIDEFLAGTFNAGKYIHTYTFTNPRKPDERIGFKIHVIENKTNHEAYLPAADSAAAAIANAHNVPLDVMGLIMSKGMGAGSGSNIRESFNLYMQLHTEVPRQTSLEALYLVKKINGWDKDICFGFRNIVFQSVNENKSGYAIEGEGNTTTDTKL